MARSRCHSNGVSRARAPIASCPSVRRRLSDRPTEHLPCVFLIWAIWGTFHSRALRYSTNAVGAKYLAMRDNNKRAMALL